MSALCSLGKSREASMQEVPEVGPRRLVQDQAFLLRCQNRGKVVSETFAVL